MSSLEKRSQMRFAVIGELLASPPENGDLGSQFERLSKKVWSDVDGRKYKFGSSTIERWYYAAKKSKNPFIALTPKKRSDEGQCFTLDADMKTELERSYKAFPRWTIQIHYDNFIVWLSMKNKNLEQQPSYTTVRRYFRRNGWDRCKTISTKEVRPYEVKHVGGLWHLDFHHGKKAIILPNGIKNYPICLAIIDDHSRLICHLQWFIHENTKALVHGFIQALLKRGIPRSLLTDNGSAMISDEFTEGLSRLSIKHETTLPYSPHQNGKQESFWGNLEGRFISLLDAEPNLTLEQLNQMSIAWVEMEYNRKVHSETKVSPVDRWQKSPTVMRDSLKIEELRKAFRKEFLRKVRRSDGTFSFEGAKFTVPLQYRTLLSVTIHAARWDLSNIDLVDAKTKKVLSPIYPVDLNENANGVRRPIGEVNNDPVVPPTRPHLLQKHIEDYAAYGTTASYLPLDEEKL